MEELNIFYLDENPVLAAQFQCDKHVVKMILESAQLLCSAKLLSGQQAPYKLTHKNHPSAIWTRARRGNYEWLLRHFEALCKEYTRRYGKIHACEGHLTALSEVPQLPDGFTEPPQAMPDEYKTTNSVEAYRAYYRHKARTIKFTYKTEAPTWL